MLVFVIFACVHGQNDSGKTVDLGDCDGDEFQDHDCDGVSVEQDCGDGDFANQLFVSQGVFSQHLQLNFA